jgi:diguanylate cyclase (GGDEF)-like protein
MDASDEERLLGWTCELLFAQSLPDFVERAAQAARFAADDVVCSLVLADPGHELRQLAFGQAGLAGSGPAVVFVDSLVSVAPQCAALHAPWSGEYRAADHALLLPDGTGVRHLLLLPLSRGPQLLGVYCVGGRAAPPALAGLATHWTAHIATAMTATVERLFERARLLRSGMTDPLTGWHSRRYLHARLCEEVARCRRQEAPATCVLVDVDHLRGINERLGQPAGDRVLRELAARLEAQMRSSDTFAHLGGDRFAALLPGATAAQAVPLAERILAAVRAAPVEVSPGTDEPIAVSIGIASVQPGVAGDRKAAADQWLAAAEVALHGAKRRGGDGYEISFAAGTSAAGR